jgi:membrane associated rhomboid family serine protease
VDPALSTSVVSELHSDLVRQKRRAFLTSSPLLLLALCGWAAAIVYPKELGSLAFLAMTTIAAIGHIGYEWLMLRRADPMALYERELAAAELRRTELIEHAIRSAAVRPVVTIALTAGIVLVTIVEFGSGPLAKAVAAAALVKPAVLGGEWWRLLTASYLHGNLIHVVGNSTALLVLGRLIETYDRRMRIPLVYLAAAIGGNIVSTLLSTRPALGASGGVLGLAGYLWVVSGRRSDGAPAWVRREMLSLLGSTALMGLAAFMFIDNAAHFGGVATGALLAAVMVPLGAESDPGGEGLEALGWIASAVLAAGALFTIMRLVEGIPGFLS